ncbi:hypothetical protein [Deinococcus ficus]|uniref:hypothetical protein n=1 Tax=Deinococcus ficus TaxID=317577 RepID=UPI001749AD23|nr:hypothetical protein [Deinococcus ficus]GHF71952.1 hypothetical protein GCM10017782_06980 [Deinococcus ficus]
MSDLHYLLILLTLAAWFYAVVTIRNDASRLHYRDRPLFWRAVTPLAGVIVLLGLALLLEGQAALLWAALPVGALGAAAAWWLDLDPQRVVRRSR